MKNKFLYILFVIFLFLQILVKVYLAPHGINIDLLFLILVYISIKSSFYRSVITGTVIGLVMDYFSMNIFGVFGFSRSLIAFIIQGGYKYLDLRRKFFIFLLVFSTLFTSNLVANFFFFLIKGVAFDLRLLVVSPLLTGLLSVFLLSIRKINKNLNVY